jgi:hypothetical protein
MNVMDRYIERIEREPCRSSVVWYSMIIGVY